MKQKDMSVWLHVIVILVGAVVLFLALAVVPRFGRGVVRVNPMMAPYYLPCLVFCWVSVLPVLAALVLSWQIFSEIGRDNSFCIANARRLRAISFLALADTVLYVIVTAVLSSLGALHLASFAALSCVVFLGLAITAITAALSYLTRKAADMKTENDLTI